MELKPGYKLTEVGVIPEEWQMNQLEDFCPFVTSGSRGWADYYSEFGDLFVRITNMSRNSIYLDLSEPRYVRLPLHKNEGTRTHLKPCDLLISITADIGIVSFVDSKIPLPAYINQHIALVRLDQEENHSRFIACNYSGPTLPIPGLT